jgi:hypothetical protein
MRLRLIPQRVREKNIDSEDVRYKSPDKLFGQGSGQEVDEIRCELI